MIADTAVLSTSPWHAGPTDQVLARDAQFPCPQFDSPIFDMDYISLGVEIEKLKTETAKISSTTAGSTMSAGTSIASSECSDEAFVEFDGDSDSLFAMSEDQDYLSSSFYNMLDVNNVPETFQFDWSDIDVNGDSLLTPTTEEISVLQEEIHVPSTQNSPQPSRKRPHSQTLTDHKPWSNMTHSEQMATIQELSDVISHKMGLREQLEVIRIMNPQANVMRTDTEFVIDLDSLSDEKLARVREFVRQHMSRSENTSSASSCSSHRSRNSQTQSTQHTKQLTKKQRKLQEKEERQRQRKEHRQMMKEKKSGLFVKEQVLSLACGTKDDVDDDIDILT